jgi:hypothetical protein
MMSLNLCILASWVQRYYDVEGRLWRDIIDHRYNNYSPRNASPFFKGVMWATKAAKWVIDGTWEMGGK